MECNRDEAIRAKDISIKKLADKDIVGAKKFAMKSQNLYPGLEGLSQLLATLDVYISAEKKMNGELDLYGVLGVEPSADDDTIRKHYRKLALTLHPDKNKLTGADGAFRILLEAWSVLSDKAKRSTYDQKQNIRAYQRPVPSGKNSVHNFTNGVNLNSGYQRTATFPKPTPPVAFPKPTPPVAFPKPTPPVTHPKPPPPATHPKPTPPATFLKHTLPVPRPSVAKPETFWTVCNRCKMQYEYLRTYLNQTLLCPNCHDPFLAVQTRPPPLNGRKASTPWRAFQKHQNSHGPRMNPPTDPNADSQKPEISGINPPNSSVFKSDFICKPGGDGSDVGSSFHVAQATLVATQGSGKLKRSCEEVLATGYRSMPMQMKKRRVDESIVHAAKGDTANQMANRYGAAGMGGVPASQRVSSTTNKFNAAGSYRSLTTRELVQTDLRKMLMEKAKMEIRKKLDKGDGATNIPKASGKEKGKEKEEAFLNGEKLSTPISNNGSDSKGIEAVAMNVPDPDFHDFDKDRTERSFDGNQIWAAYDDDDGMPRYYAMIHAVVSIKPFKMRISWLNSKSNNELSPINWIGSGFPKTSGDFRIGKHEVNGALNAFSHKVKWVKGARGVIHIYPCKGEVWALYRNWSPDWNELTPDEVIHKYDMVEVLEDYNGERGVAIIPLVKVAGFKTVFQQHSDPGQVKTIPREELFRFSHQVPSYLLTGKEAQNAPVGCREIDPAASPLELLQVVADIKEENTAGNDEICRSLDDTEFIHETEVDTEATVKNLKKTEVEGGTDQAAGGR